jgi:serine/threonine protein kinase
VSYSGDVKLIDFGVAKDDVSTRLTLTGMIVGTPAYMAPEQANGEPLSAGSDLFSTGILLYELLTGIKPFFGDNNTEILAKIVRNKYIPAERINPEIPRPFRKIIKKAIHKDQKHRYQNATEMINDLENAISWQTRSTKKTVIGRFLKDLDKTRETASTDSIKLQIFSAMPTWGWTVLRGALGVLIAFLMVFQGIRFNESQLGYLQLQGQDNKYAVKINDSQTKQITNQSTVLGPFLKGDYILRAFKAQTPGVFVADINISAQDTFRLQIPKVTVTDSVQLSINSEPIDSYVYIDDKLAGRTPVDSLRLPSGKHRISFSKTGYQQRDESIELESGQFYAFRFRLTRQR